MATLLAAFRTRFPADIQTPESVYHQVFDIAPRTRAQATAANLAALENLPGVISTPQSPLTPLASLISLPNTQQIPSQQILSTIMTTLTPAMPSRGHTSAPKFSADQPRELNRFFQELENLFTGSNVTDSQAKKEHAIRYVDIDLVEFWSATADFVPAKTYDEWKTGLKKYYPGSQDEEKFSVADIDRLVGETMHVGIRSLADLLKYYSTYFTISTYLIEKERMGKIEQSKTFVQALQPDLWARTLQKLQEGKKDQHRDVPFPIADIYDAATAVLLASGGAILVQSTIPYAPHYPSISFVRSNTPVPVVQSQTGIKMEDLNSMFERFAQTMVAALGTHSTPMMHSLVMTGTCNGCGKLGHYIGACPDMERLILEGKCRRNSEGKLVLPSGAFIPRIIIGRNLMERFEEYHRLNPGQIALGQLTLNANVSTQLLYGCMPDAANLLLQFYD
jgi:hypothetical protein